jgi:hypothetical protein
MEQKNPHYDYVVDGDKPFGALDYFMIFIIGCISLPGLMLMAREEKRHQKTNLPPAKIKNAAIAAREGR